MMAALFCSFLLSAVIVKAAERMQIWWHYVDKEAYFKAVEREGHYYVANIPRPSFYQTTQTDHFISEFCDFLQTYTVLIPSMAGNCVAIFLFYRNKLRKPIEELAQTSKRIAENHLDFNIVYKAPPTA